MGILAAVDVASQVADAIGKIKTVIEGLTPKRAVILEVQNLTGAPLKRVAFDHADGGFAEIPSIDIPPGQADVFGATSTGIASGTKGRVTYESDAGFLVNVGWSNPITGSPDATSSVGGDNAGNFEVRDVAGAGHTAQMQYVVRPGLTPSLIVRNGSAEAGRVSEIAAVRSGASDVLTAVRAGDDTLKLIQWSVSADGAAISRIADSGSAAGEASGIDIARGRLFVTACRSGAGKLVLISWELRTSAGVTSIVRRGDSRSASGGDRAGEARSARIVALTDTLFVTAVRNASGNLVLIAWRLEDDGELIRVADSADQAQAVTEIALVKVSPDAAGNHRVVTAVRGGDGTLVMISWSVAPDGSSIRRLAFDHGQGGTGIADLIRAVATGPTRVVTSVRSASGNLVLISWSLDANGTLARLSDSHGQAGRILDNALMSRPGGVLSAVHGLDGLRLIRWTVSAQGAIARVSDSGSQAGVARRIALPQEELQGSASIITAVQTADENLKLISWRDGSPATLPKTRKPNVPSKQASG